MCHSLELMSNPKSVTKGLDLLNCLIQKTTQKSIKKEDIKDSPFFDLIQKVVGFMTICPIGSLRTDYFEALKKYIGLFEDRTRFELFRDIIVSCPYSSLTGLIIYQLKQDVENSWNDRNSPFMSSELLDIFLTKNPSSDILSNIDIILNILSFYRFLLIKDKGTNYTGIWSPSSISSIKGAFLGPLLTLVDELLNQHLDDSTKKKEKNK